MSAHRYRLSNDFGRDAAGAVVASGKLYFYVTSTTTPLDTYSDAGLSSANANPVVADSSGKFGDIYLGNGGPYKVVLTTSAGVTQWTEDPVYRDKVRLYLSALPSVNWPGLEVVLSTDGKLYERKSDDSGWIDRGAADSVGNTASVTEQLAGTESAKYATPDSVAGLWQRGSNITPSGGTVTLPSGGGGVFNIAAGNFSAISSAAGGRALKFIFGGVSVITHNATSMILPGAADITTVAGDTAEFINEAAADASGSNWRCFRYTRASGSPLNIADLDAVKADQETGTSTTLIVTPGVQHYHDSAAKAWASHTTSGTTLTKNDSYNVTSVTRTGTGVHYYTFTTAFSSANYAGSAIIERASVSSAGWPAVTSGVSPTTTVFQVTCLSDGGAAVEPGFGCAIFHGDQ